MKRGRALPLERAAAGQDMPRFFPLFLLISILLEALSYSPVTVGSGGEEQFGRQPAGCTESYLLTGALLAGEIRFTGFLSLFSPILCGLRLLFRLSSFCLSS